MNKKTLYFVLFMLLNLIEWLKATQDGDVWMVAVNCTGLVMMVMIMSAYPVKELLNPFHVIWTGICIAALVGVYLYWKANTYPFILWKYLTGVMNIWWIVMLAVYLLCRWKQGKMSHVKWNILGIFAVVMSFLLIFSVSQRVWPIWFFFMFGMFYLTKYSVSDREALINGMINGTIASFFIIQIYAYGFRPYDEVRYKGAFGNCNMMALYYLIVYCMVLTKLHFFQLQGEKKWKKAFWMFGAAGLLVFQFMTLCRTAMMSSFVVTLVYGLLVMYSKWKLSLKGLIGRALLLGVGVLVAFPLVFGTIRWLPAILHRPVWYSGEYHKDKVHSFDPADSWKYVSLEEFLESALGRFVHLLSTQDDTVAETMPPQQNNNVSAEVTAQPYVVEMETAAETVDAIIAENPESTDISDADLPETPVLSPGKEWSSGEIRKAIWKCYINDLNLTGHAETEGYYLITENYRCWHAQNLWLQIAYYYGVGAGVVLAVLTVVMIVYYIRRYAKGLHDIRYGLIPVLIVLVYFTFGTLETVWNPGQLIVNLFFLVQHPMFRQINEDDKENEKTFKVSKDS